MAAKLTQTAATAVLIQTVSAKPARAVSKRKTAVRLIQTAGVFLRWRIDTPQGALECAPFSLRQPWNCRLGFCRALFR